MLFFGRGTFAERLSAASAAFAGDPVVGKIVSFIRDGGNRPLMMPAAERRRATDPECRSHERAGGPARRTARSALAIICGGGSLPFALADAAAAPRPARGAVRAARLGRSAARRPPIRTIGAGWASSADSYGSRPRKAAVTSLSSDRWRGRRSGNIRPDLRVLRLMPQIVRLYRGGDDHLQSGIGRMFEQHGFRLLGPKDIAPELMMPLGPLGSRDAERARPGRHRARACPAGREQPVRHRAGGGRCRQPGARRRGPGGHRPDAGAGGRIARERPHPHAGRRRRAGQGRQDRPGPSHRPADDRSADRRGRRAARACRHRRRGRHRRSSPSRAQSPRRPTARKYSSSASIA